MASRAVVVYICDRCLVTVEVPDDRKASELTAPKGWVEVVAEPMNEADLPNRPEATRWEICPVCFREHLQRALAPVERVRDMQDPGRA